VTGSAPTSGRTLDYAAPVYDALQPLMTLGAEQRFNRQVVEELSPAPGSRILDIGCGTGVLTALIGTRLDAGGGGKAVGIDAAARMIAVANRRRSSPTTQFDVAAAERLPYEDKTFDAVCSSFFFHHVDYELKRAALAEAMRVMRPGGRMVVIDIDTPTSFYGRFCMRLAEWMFRQPAIGENRRGLLRRAFEESGYSEWRAEGHWQGYITLFTMRKKAE
jgi:ubiquinone/menaquinone biosynthesis C-methylase UbiE